jgi:hypothetical protein
MENLMHGGYAGVFDACQHLSLPQKYIQRVAVYLLVNGYYLRLSFRAVAYALREMLFEHNLSP